MGDQALTDFQREVANVFFALPESGGYLLAGGAALVASELTARPTRDLDLFTHAPVESIDAARDALIVAATDRRWTTTVIRDAPTFCRLVIHGPEDLVVDLAVDSPPASPPTTTYRPCARSSPHGPRNSSPERPLRTKTLSAQTSGGTSRSPQSLLPTPIRHSTLLSG